MKTISSLNRSWSGKVRNIWDISFDIVAHGETPALADDINEWGNYEIGRVAQSMMEEQIDMSQAFLQRSWYPKGDGRTYTRMLDHSHGVVLVEIVPYRDYLIGESIAADMDVQVIKY